MYVADIPDSGVSCLAIVYSASAEITMSTALWPSGVRATPLTLTCSIILTSAPASTVDKSSLPLLTTKEPRVLA